MVLIPLSVEQPAKSKLENWRRPMLPFSPDLTGQAAGFCPLINLIVGICGERGEGGGEQDG